MTYIEVLNQVNDMIASGNFNYIKYLNLIDQNNLTAFLFMVCESIFLWTVIIMTWGIIKYAKAVVLSIKEEIEEG